MLKLSENIVISSVDSELVLLDSVSGKYFGLNTTASRIMELLKRVMAKRLSVLLWQKSTEHHLSVLTKI
jgi:hypothetical protein